eukprot:TRINITY_DN6469_c0_g1_i7.p1 TRINITY_DN6469_c0_g1~~TRINITY_DN6469_c0_g1_i7.p1  ORF type:complete len:144 (+),score=2.46 TRINITY_DN6469_c0_g1_i7:1190-1621(+)
MMGIKATIFRAKLDQRIWYLACIKCGKRAQRNNTNSSCQVCNLSTTETYPRYIVQLTLIDHTDSLNVVLFDDDVAHILKASKDELSTLIGDVRLYSQYFLHSNIRKMISYFHQTHCYSLCKKMRLIKLLRSSRAFFGNLLFFT